MIVLPSIDEEKLLHTRIRRHSLNSEYFTNSIDKSEAKEDAFIFKSKEAENTLSYSDGNFARNTRVKFLIDSTRKPTKLPPLSSLAKTYNDEDEYISTSIASRSSKKSDKSKEAKSPRFGRDSNIHLITSRAKLAALDDPKRYNRPESYLTYQETIYRKKYDAKTEELKKSAANAERAIRAKQLYLQNKYPLNYNKKKKTDEYTEENLTEEVSKFVSLVKRLTIKEGQTPLPQKLRESPKFPRPFSNLSIEGQYALLKTYEDTIANVIAESYPKLEPYIPRVMTAKFRKRPLGHKTSIIHRLNPRRESTTSSKIKLRQSVIKPPSLNSSHNNLEHKLRVSTELEIAQEILDLIKLQKGEYVTGEKINEKMDVLRTYAIFVKLWAKHFNLR